MEALLFDGTLHFRKDYPRPIPGPGEALIRVRMAGICATDLEITRGYMQYAGILGHEFVGVVEQAPDPTWIGARVVGEINVACGRCVACQKGLPRHCPHRTVLGIQGRDGAFAQYVCLPLANLHRVPEALPDEAAVFVEPLAAAFRILEQISLEASHRVYVLGDGRLGLLVTQVLRITGAQVTLLGRHPEKMARVKGVATQVVPPWPRDRVDVVVDCTGRPEGLAQALELVRPLGTIILKTTCVDPSVLSLSPVVIHEVQILGSRCGPFPPALEALVRKQVDVRSLVDAVYPLQEGVQAFAEAQRPGVLKVLFHLSS